MRVPLLVLHITAGTLGMLSGFVAISFRKGSRRFAGGHAQHAYAKAGCG
jgi:hypothetical protein